jgi:hypothetical protein
VYIWVATGGHLDDYPTEDASRFVEEFAEYVETRVPEVLASIRDTGDLSDTAEAALREASEAFKATFVASDTGAGSEAAAGLGSAADEVKKDIGWDRMSSDEGDLAPPPTRDEMRHEFEEKAGPVGEADVPFPG